MRNILLYTFRTFPWIGELSELNTELFVFGKLREDLPKFFEIVENINPEIIIGIAKSPDDTSRFETRAVNVFNKTKKISKEGAENYALDFPGGGFGSIKINNSYTDSFCNWTMYKISELCARAHNSLKYDNKLQFVHVAEKDLCKLIEYLYTIEKEIPPARSE